MWVVQITSVIIGAVVSLQCLSMDRRVAINIWDTSITYGAGIEFSSRDSIAIPRDSECCMPVIVDIHFPTWNHSKHRDGQDHKI